MNIIKKDYLSSLNDTKLKVQLLLNIDDMEKFLVIVSVFVVTGCSSIKDISSLSRHLYKLQKNEKECGIYPKIAYQQRLRLADKIDFINYDRDTIYLLESYYIETANFYEAIWTKKGKIEYLARGKHIEVGTDYFIKRLFVLVENWDIATIREEDRKSNLLGGGMMLGARLFIEQGHLKIQCVKFDEFFDLQKDK